MSICAGLNFLPIIISILCCGLLFIYFNVRITEIKFAVEKQNKVLTSFITNIQHDIRGGGVVPSHKKDFATAEAYAAVKQGNDKIVVSEDEDDSDSNSDSDSDSDSDSEDKEERKIINVCQSINSTSQNIDLTSHVEMISLAFEILPVSEEGESSITEIIETSIEGDDLENKDEDRVSMKIDDLRKVVVEKHLSSKEESKKLKKPELLALLKK
jgi:hypothetical protein